MKLKILLNLLLLLIAGCSKTTVIDKITYPSQTRSGINYVDDKRDLSRLAWWRKLQDPVLTKLITKALTCNNDIKAANATILQARAQLKSAQFAWLPTLDASVNSFSIRTWDTHIRPQGMLASSSINPFLKNLHNPKLHGYETGFVPSYSVNILNNINKVKAASASLGIIQANAEATKLAIISQMSGAYFMLLSQRAQLELEKTLIKDMKKLRELEQERYQSGASDIERVTTLTQDLAQEETKIPQIEGVIAQTENTIHVLLNQNPGPIPTRRKILSLNTESLIPKNLPSSVLKNRPDIMIAVNNLKAADAQIGQAYSAFFPTISLTGLLGEASIDLVHLLRLSTNLWIGQAAATMKIFNASAYEDIKAAKANLYSVSFNYIQTLRNAFADVDNSLTNELTMRRALQQTRKGYAAAKKTYAIALEQYQAGGKDYRDVFNAKINLDRYALILVQQKAQLLDNIVQIYNAVAGGYQAYQVCLQ